MTTPPCRVRCTCRRSESARRLREIGCHIPSDSKRRGFMAIWPRNRVTVRRRRLGGPYPTVTARTLPGGNAPRENLTRTPDALSRRSHACASLTRDPLSGLGPGPRPGNSCALREPCWRGLWQGAAPNEPSAAPPPGTRGIASRPRHAGSVARGPRFGFLRGPARWRDGAAAVAGDLMRLPHACPVLLWGVTRSMVPGAPSDFVTSS